VGGQIVGRGTIYASHDPTAVRDIRGKDENGNPTAKAYGGTVFQVPVYVPEGDGARVRCQLKVYDLAGNLVISGESDDAVRGMEQKGQFPEKGMHLYWNGYNSKAMKVAPGTYRMVVYVTYEGNLSDEDKRFAKDKKYQGVVGISK